MPTIFCDMHHGSLYHSLHILFVERLGWNLVRPIGMEWGEHGYWYINNNQSAELELETQRQYLEPAGTWIGDDGYTRWYDAAELFEHKCMTFEQFNSVPIDVVMCTYPHAETMYARLAKSCGAKFIRWLGNTGDEWIDPLVSRNIIDTMGVWYPMYAMRCNCILIHQEFPLDVFSYKPPTENRIIRQYRNFLHKQEFHELWDHYREVMPEFTWMEHGAEGKEGVLSPVTEIAKAMANSLFTWEVKRGGGHIFNNSCAVGRPVVLVKRFHERMITKKMLTDGVTCIDLAGKSHTEVMETIRYHSQPDEHLRMCEAVRDRYDMVFDFDAEEQKVRRFLGRLR